MPFLYAYNIDSPVSLTNRNKAVSDPNSKYVSMAPTWQRIRAVVGGEKYAKAYDSTIDQQYFTNLLVPFSSSMTQDQYNFYRAEAELPGTSAQFVRMMIGGLLRKAPLFELESVEGKQEKQMQMQQQAVSQAQPMDVETGERPAPPKAALPKKPTEKATFTDEQAEEIQCWIKDKFGPDGSTLISWLSDALYEELQTSRAWVYVTYPYVDPNRVLTPEEKKDIKPFPVLFSAESIINWAVENDPINGQQRLTRVIARGFVQRETDQNEFHPDYIDTVWVHELDPATGYYRVRTYERPPQQSDSQPVVQGKIQQIYPVYLNNGLFEEVSRDDNIMVNGKPLDFIPFFPLNGSYEIQEPFMNVYVDREIALYNKIARRNHLLLGSAMYTPVVVGPLSDDDKIKIASQGLGSWLFLPPDSTVDILKPPSESLKDLELAVTNAYSELARLGMRMLAPDESAQPESGVALEIRNASQNAQLGLLNVKISDTMQHIIHLMISWYYDMPDLEEKEIDFELSADFDPTPLGEPYLKLVTEWYQTGLIPREVWLRIIKANDIIDSDYDDLEAQESIMGDPNIVPAREEFDMEQKVGAADRDLQAKSIAAKKQSGPAIQ